MSQSSPMAISPPLLEGPKLLLLTVSVALATFMEVLDTSIANVAIPTIAGDLGVSPNQGTWVISSYAVASAIAVPLTGWLAKRWGESRLFIASVIGFTLMSMLCGMATSLEMLVVSRLLQGLLSGPMIPLSQSILLRNYPPSKRGLALGLWSMTVVVAPIFGPVLGGWITDHYKWSWIFYVNAPIGIFSAIVAHRLLKGRETETTKTPIDKMGLMLLVIGVGALQLMLDNGNDLDWFNSSFITTLAIISIVSITLFVPWTLQEAYPIVDLSLFKMRNFTVGVLAQTFGYMTFFCSVVIFPLWLQTVMGYTAGWAGLAMAPIGVFSVLLSPIVGKNLHRFDLRAVASIGFLVFAIVMWWSSHFTIEASYIQLISPRILQGIGIACFFIPISGIILSGVHPSRVAAAAGMSNFLRSLGGAIGTAISVTVWDHRKNFHHARLVEDLQDSRAPLQDYLLTLENLNLPEAARLAILDNTVTTQSFTLATNDIFWLSTGIFLLLLVVVWQARPPFNVSGGAGH